MIPRPSPTPPDPDERLLTVARILAEGILRRRLRQIVAKRPQGTGENCLEVPARPSAHVVETSRNGEPPR